MKKMLSTPDVARMLGVAPASVAKWIDHGQLKAGRTPGGHRRILAEDLLDFVRRQSLPVPMELTPLRPRILIVDGEKSVTALVAAQVKKGLPSCDIHCAHDGYAAGELVSSLKPAVVVLDLKMPGMDGFEVCRRIKSNKETSGTVVIAVMAIYSPDVKGRIIDCGAKACLSKPLDNQMLLREVTAALNGRG